MTHTKIVGLDRLSYLLDWAETMERKASARAALLRDRGDEDLAEYHVGRVSAFYSMQVELRREIGDAR